MKKKENLEKLVDINQNQNPEHTENQKRSTSVGRLYIENTYENPNSEGLIPILRTLDPILAGGVGCLLLRSNSNQS